MMAEKYQGKYRIASARRPGWDYGTNAAYFVTICTKNRRAFFGDITAGEMALSDIGQWADRYWRAIPTHFPFVRLGAFVVMPNHVHGIVVIDKPETPESRSPIPVETPDSGVSTGMGGGGDDNDNTNKSRTAAASKKWKPGTLGVIINQYKRAVTIAARKIDPKFGWQARFHDHIIRNGASFDRISQYIHNNPQNWVDDKFYL